jgi:hypothetical protein
MKTIIWLALKATPLALVAALFLTNPRAARAEDEPKALATAKHPLGLTVEVLSVEVDNTQDKLKVTWRYTNSTKKAIRLVAPKGPFAVRRPEFVVYWDGVSYTSGKFSEKSYRHSVLRTADNYYDGTDIRRTGLTVPAGGSFEMYAKFGKPAAGSKMIHLQLPDLPPFEDLPVGSAK